MINIARHILIAIQILAVLLQTFDKALLWSGFSINQQYIAANLCENRNKPQLHCEGNCQLRKAFEKLNDQKKEQHLPKEIKTDILICEIFKPVWLQPKQLPAEDYKYPSDDAAPSTQFLSDILKPPIFLA